MNNSELMVVQQSVQLRATARQLVAEARQLTSELREAHLRLLDDVEAAHKGQLLVPLSDEPSW